MLIVGDGKEVNNKGWNIDKKIFDPNQEFNSDKSLKESNWIKILF